MLDHDPENHQNDKRNRDQICPVVDPAQDFEHPPDAGPPLDVHPARGARAAATKEPDRVAVLTGQLVSAAVFLELFELAHAPLDLGRRQVSDTGINLVFEQLEPGGRVAAVGFNRGPVGVLMCEDWIVPAERVLQ